MVGLKVCSFSFSNVLDCLSFTGVLKNSPLRWTLEQAQDGSITSHWSVGGFLNVATGRCWLCSGKRLRFLLTIVGFFALMESNSIRHFKTKEFIPSWTAQQLRSTPTPWTNLWTTAAAFQTRLRSVWEASGEKITRWNIFTGLQQRALRPFDLVLTTLWYLLLLSSFREGQFVRDERMKCCTF